MSMQAAPTNPTYVQDMVKDDFMREAVVGKGLSGALNLLKDRGELKKQRTISIILKKNLPNIERDMLDKKKESKHEAMEKYYKQKEICVEKRDEFGRVMTEKQAFKALCHNFHGKAPSKTKKEKRLKRYEEEKKRTMQISDRELLSLQRMKKFQASSKSPYVVLYKGCGMV